MSIIIDFIDKISSKNLRWYKARFSAFSPIRKATISILLLIALYIVYVLFSPYISNIASLWEFIKMNKIIILILSFVLIALSYLLNKKTTLSPGLEICDIHYVPSEKSSDVTRVYQIIAKNISNKDTILTEIGVKYVYIPGLNYSCEEVKRVKYDDDFFIEMEIGTDDNASHKIKRLNEPIIIPPDKYYDFELLVGYTFKDEIGLHSAVGWELVFSIYFKDIKGQEYYIFREECWNSLQVIYYGNYIEELRKLG